MSEAVIIGYQGIGKSHTVVENPGLYIDFESTNFRDDKGNRPDDWYVYYCNAAWDMAKQGYRVFTASHEVVRKRFYELQKRDGLDESPLVIIAYPIPSLKEEWLKRLKDRYDKIPEKKNEIAYLNALDRYTDNIEELHNDAIEYNFGELKIQNTNYKLHNLIEAFLRED